MLGRFKQWVIFDFGPMVRPVVKREFTVHVGLKSQDLVKDEELNSATRKTWDATNARIIPFDSVVPREYTTAMERYRTSDFHVDLEEDMILTQSNYKQMMHHLLREEELARQQKLSK